MKLKRSFACVTTRSANIYLLMKHYKIFKYAELKTTAEGDASRVLLCLIKAQTSWVNFSTFRLKNNRYPHNCLLSSRRATGIITTYSYNFDAARISIYVVMAGKMAKSVSPANSNCVRCACNVTDIFVRL